MAAVKLINKILDNFSETTQGNLMLKVFGLTKVPMLYWIGSSVHSISDDEIVVKIPLSRRTKNHLNSMYFGVLSCGADAAGGLIAMRTIQKSGKNVSLAFKDFKADFLKRAESDTYFRCSDGKAIMQLVNKCIESGERENLTVHVEATCPDLLGDEPVAKFELTLSLKDYSKR